MHDLNGTIALAKMRAAQDFTHARVYADLANNTFHLEVWNKTGGAGGTGCWKTDGDVVNACTVAGTSPVQNLSVGVTFGFGGASAGGPNPQNPIAQATSCYTGVAITGLAGGVTGNTACIEFNSRGIPVDPSNGGAPTANDALYVTDGNTVYGATVNAGGFIQDWETPTSATSWAPR